ncbi:MAG: carbohydrate kinase family protein [Kiritimatiellales bacterium]
MAKVYVAGHICLDIIPGLDRQVSALSEIFVPGTLTEIGPAVIATGGAVANTGIALHRLGIETTLMAKVGDDDFGRAIMRALRRWCGDGPVSGMRVDPDVDTSYTVVVNSPGIDRLFLHCPGANHDFSADDMDCSKMEPGGLFHFGYPPLMRKMYREDGAEMKKIFERVRQTGALTSLDMTRPDPSSESGQVDWLSWLKNVLPSVDIFLPSIDEILYMVNRPEYDALVAKHGADHLMEGIDAGLVRKTARTLIEMGVSVAVIKLGDQGLYLQTGAKVPARGAEWAHADIFEPCYVAKVVGTTGAGDCAIAGFLAGFVKGMTPADTMHGGAGVASCSTESADATGAVPHWDEVWRRIMAGWGRLESRFIRGVLK